MSHKRIFYFKFAINNWRSGVYFKIFYDSSLQRWVFPGIFSFGSKVSISDPQLDHRGGELWCSQTVHFDSSTKRDTLYYYSSYLIAYLIIESMIFDSNLKIFNDIPIQRLSKGSCSQTVYSECSTKKGI